MKQDQPSAMSNLLSCIFLRKTVIIVIAILLLLVTALPVFQFSLAQQKITAIQPLRDGDKVFPAIHSLIKDADKFVHVAIWALDGELRLSPDTVFPLLHTRSNKVRSGPMDTVEDLNCNGGGLDKLPPGPLGRTGPLDHRSMITLLRCKAAELAYQEELKPGLTSLQQDQARGDIKVLVWSHLPVVDRDDFAPPMTNLDDLAYIMVERKPLIGWNRKQLHDEMRRRGSGESMDVLLTFQKEYAKPAYSLIDEVPMPTGILIMTQKNENATDASHHQKLVVTDKGAYIGGLNFLKEYWDDSNHNPISAYRFSSGTIFGSPSPTDYNGPLHDTGAIVQGDIVPTINSLFIERWDTSITNWHGEPDGRAGKTPYGKILKILYRPPFRVDNGLLVIDNAITLRRTIKQIEGRPYVRIPQVSPTKYQNILLDEIVFAQSHPDKSYKGTAPPQEIRDNYNNTIRSMMTGNSSFAYFENQYASDHDIFLELWKACNPKYTDKWCRRDEFAYLVIPYKPQAIGIDRIDRKLMKGTIQQETKNILWLEIKTARTVYNRTTGKMIVTLNTPSPLPCTACGHKEPYIRFDDPATDKDPANLKITDTVTMFGKVAEKGVATCDNGQTVTCTKQEKFTLPVKDLITDGGFMAYVIANSGEAKAIPAPAGFKLTEQHIKKLLRYNMPLRNQIALERLKGREFKGRDEFSAILNREIWDWQSRQIILRETIFADYHNYLEEFAIYIHSKFSAFFEPSRPKERYRYVIGSANLNPRSLGVVTGRHKEAEDSETALFWDSDRNFWNELWTEHLGPLNSPVPSATGEWRLQGWRNWELIRGGGKPSSKTRVVRLDAVERCLRANACP